MSVNHNTNKKRRFACGRRQKTKSALRETNAREMSKNIECTKRFFVQLIKEIKEKILMAI